MTVLNVPTVTPVRKRQMSPLARHAVLLVHGLGGDSGRQAFLGFVGGPPPAKEDLAAGDAAGESGLAELGDQVVSRPSLLAGAYAAPVEAVTWNHDPEATVLAQQHDAPPLWEGSAVTDFYEVRCSGPFRERTFSLGRLVTGRRAAQERAEVFAADRDGVADLVEALHAVRDHTGRNGYDRVTVVGHRWGGAIAAAALQTCWQRRSAPAGPARSQDVAVAEEDVATAAARLAAHPAEDDPAAPALRAELRQAREMLYRLLRDQPHDPHRWLVSDLVTLGFPDRPHAARPPGPVRWTNAWFRHDPDAGPLAEQLRGEVEDVSLGGSWFAGLAPGSEATYWTESTHRMNREGSRLSIALLRRLVRRRPTLLLSTRRAPDPVLTGALTAALEQAARYPTARGAVLADVRLVVGEEPATGTPWPLPVGALPVPATIALREVRELLGPGGRATVLLSSDLLPPLQPS